jgi:hypothetical protein
VEVLSFLIAQSDWSFPKTEMYTVWRPFLLLRVPLVRKECCITRLLSRQNAIAFSFFQSWINCSQATVALEKYNVQIRLQKIVSYCWKMKKAFLELPIFKLEIFLEIFYVKTQYSKLKKRKFQKQLLIFEKQLTI